MTKEIESNKRKIEKTKDGIYAMRNNYLDTDRFDYLLNSFIEVMNGRIAFCEELVTFINDKESNPEDILAAKEKIREVLAENLNLKEKWVLHFEKEKNKVKVIS